MKFQVGDIVEVYFDEHSIFACWSGLIIKVEAVNTVEPTISSNSISGKVLETVPGVHYMTGDPIEWGCISALRQVSIDKLHQLAQKQKKYYSPFTGKWT